MTTLPTAPIFGTLPGLGVFCVPADAEAAHAAFRVLRIRPYGAPLNCRVDGFGVTPGHAAARGTEAVVFTVTVEARRRLRDAGLIDRDRIVTEGS